MKTLLLLLMLLPLAGARGFQSCEYLQPNSITIFPVCGDSSLYIQRRFELNQFIYEDVYENEGHTFSTKIWFVGKEMPDSASFTEFTYWDGKLINTRSSQLLASALHRKFLSVNDSLHFEIRCHDNGFIQSYGLMNSFCQVYGVDSDPQNRYFWKGAFADPAKDTVKNIIAKVPLQPIAVHTKCGHRTGVWRKLDARGNIVDSVDMTGSIDEGASGRLKRIRESIDRQR